LLAVHGARVTAIDASPEMPRLATERVPPSVVLRRASIARPFEFLADASIDLAISPLVLDSIKDWRPVMRELARVLVPDGLLVFSVGHPMVTAAPTPRGSSPSGRRRCVYAQTLHA
jgi:SAM-dependent methyltransferase